MRGWKKGISAALAAALILTALPVDGISRVHAEADATVKMLPGEASTFNDTNYDGLGEFQGWGTSLCWWANRLGYSERLTSEAAAKFYGDDGLDLNIGRYNVGGGDNVEDGEYAEENEFLHAAHIERSDSMVPGYCKDVTKMDLEIHNLAYYTDNFDRADETSGYAWNYNWEADHRQLAILEAAMKASGEDFIAEAFSNSPPYFMTNSGCSSGAEKSSEDNLRKDCYKAFAAYMADVVVHWAEVGFVDFTSTTPMNEPYTSYWGANSKKQEGCHFDQGESESTIIEEYYDELHRQLKAAKNENVKRVLSNLIICGTDETSIDTAISSYNKLSDKAKNSIQRIDTHTYGGSKRAELSALAEREGKNLWMSEIDVGGKAGTDAGEMAPALCFAQRIITDLNGLKPSAWIMWNAIDIHVDRNSTSKYDAKESIEEMKNMTYDDGTVMYDPAKAGYWGIVIADHNNEELILTKKYYAYGQFSRYIRPGYTIMGTSDKENTVIAYDPKGKNTVIVTMNTSGSEQTREFDLSEFKAIGSTVKAYRTSGLTEGGENWADISSDSSISVDTSAKSVSASLPANSITTFIVEGTDYDVDQNYELAEKNIIKTIREEVFAENDATMEVNMQNVEAVTLNADMVTGSAPWNNGTTDTPQKVVDGDFTTYFDGVENGWVQIDLGKQEKIAGFGYAPRSGSAYVGRCVGASFYGSNDGTNWTKLYTISATPAEGVLTNVYASRFEVPNNTAYRYIKYAVPEGDSSAACNVSELAVYRWKSGSNVTFKEPASPNNLQEWIAYYKSKTEGNAYSNSSKAAFQSAMAAAEAVAGSSNTVEQNKARRNLALAYLGLKPETEADRLENARNILQKGITANTVPDSKKNQYTQSTWDNYQKKLAAAKNLLKSGTLTKTQAEQAVRELATAKNALKPKSKLNQTITCTKIVNKTYGDKAFSLGAKVKNGDGKLSYKSSNTRVADCNNKNGKVTIKGTGSCIITITAAETANYKKASTNVTITVKPKKMSIKGVTAAKKSLKVTWKKDSKATGYEIQCSLTKNFKKVAAKADVKVKKTSVTLKKLKKGKKYYVRIRAYKTAKVNGKNKKLTGAWSKTKISKQVK